MSPRVDLESIERHDEAAGATGERLCLGDVLLAQMKVRLHVPVVQGFLEQLLACVNCSPPSGEVSGTMTELNGRL